MSHSEWELLANSEDIERGDYVLVETEDGRTQRLQFLKQKGNDYIILKDISGQIFKFSTDSLEESEGERVIIGKA